MDEQSKAAASSFVRLPCAGMKCKWWIGTRHRIGLLALCVSGKHPICLPMQLSAESFRQPTASLKFSQLEVYSTLYSIKDKFSFILFQYLSSFETRCHINSSILLQRFEPPHSWRKIILQNGIKRAAKYQRRFWIYQFPTYSSWLC